MAAEIRSAFDGSQSTSPTNIKEAVDKLLSRKESFLNDFELFIKEKESNATFLFWKQYMDSIEYLLDFISAERDGDWIVHLTSFRDMMSLMALYDHFNYTRWGIIYLADMLELEHTAPDVHKEFLSGNFVVKESVGVFNQVHTDMALEHVNKLCKVAGGIIGITRSKPALDRWMLSCCDLARLVDDVHSLTGLSSNKTVTHKDTGKQRIDRDEGDVCKLQEQLQKFNPFARNCTDLMCISSNDIVPPDVQRDLLTAQERGKQLLIRFMQDRLQPNATQMFRAPITKNKSKTFANLH